MANQIQLAGNFRREEAVAAGTITPGMLVAVDSAGKVAAHAVQGGYAERAFAVEDALQGHTVSDDYSADDVVSYNLAAPGSEVNALIAGGEDIAIGDQLVSGGDGCLIESGSGSSETVVRQILAIAMAAVSSDSSDGVNTLAKVRIV